MPRLDVSSRAARDIQELIRFGVTTYGFRFTDDYARQLRQRLNQLPEMPFIVASRGDIGPDMRLLVFKAHNVPYRVTEDAVIIVRVLHRSANRSDLL